MDRETAKQLLAACEQALAALTAAEHAIGKIEDDEERKALFLALGETIGDVLQHLRAPVMRQYPELAPPVERGEPDTLLEPEDLEAVERLTARDIQRIDEALMAQCAPSWRKVARIVGSAMGVVREQLPDVALGYYVQRVVALVEAGGLESQGDARYIRFSEVRLSEG